MKTPLIAGLILGLLVVVWTFVMGFTGWYLDPVLLNLFWVVIGIQTVVLVVTLWRTRAGRSYGQQVGVGLITSAVAAVVIFVGSIAFTSLVFPDYFRDLRAVQERLMRDDGATEETIAETLDSIAASQTPTGQAFAGFMGTLGTGLVVSCAAAAFLREREPARTA